MRLKIKQSYLGDNRYKYELYDHMEGFLGEILKNFNWYNLQQGKVVNFNNEKYYIDMVYDCENSPEEDEVIIYELTPIAADVSLWLV